MPYQKSTGNPFFVAPADYATSLKGFSDTINSRMEFGQKKVADQHQTNIRREAANLLESGDSMGLSKLVIENPELKDGVGWAMEQTAKIDDKKTKKDAWDWLLAKTPEEKIAIGDRRIGEGKQVQADMIDTAGAVVGVRNGDVGYGDMMAKMALARLDPKGLAQWEKVMGDGPEQAEVKRSKILDDGTTISIMKNNKRIVRDKNGKVVKGVEAAYAIEEANKTSTGLQGARSGARETEKQKALLDLQGKVAANTLTAKNAAKAADDMISSLSGIGQKKEYMNETVRLIDSGAATGPIMDRMPTFRAASMELKNIQAKLGLNVIQNTTFGSLSETELKFALSSALPTGLKGPELRDWAVRKIDALDKLEDYIGAASIYLSQPGNTRAGWLETQRNKVPEDTSEKSIEDMSIEETEAEIARLKGVK